MGRRPTFPPSFVSLTPNLDHKLNPIADPQVLRELSTKRIGFDKAAFVKTSADLLPVLCQAWDAQWALIEGLLVAVAAGNVPAGDSEAGVKAAEAMSLGTVCIKVCWAGYSKCAWRAG